MLKNKIQLLLFVFTFVNHSNIFIVRYYNKYLCSYLMCDNKLIIFEIDNIWKIINELGLTKVIGKGKDIINIIDPNKSNKVTVT